MIIIRLPSTLQVHGRNRLDVDEPIANVDQLIDAIDRRIPGFRNQLDDAVFNFAVNDEMLLYRARDCALKDGDIVEVIPTISGG